MQTFQTSTCIRHELTFSPNGRYLLVGSGWAILLDTLGSDPPDVLKPPSGPSVERRARFALGGSAIVYTTASDVCVCDLATRRVTRWAGAGQLVDALVVGPDGTTAYVASRVLTGSNTAWATEILAFDLTTWERKGQFRIREGAFPWLVLSADGRRLAGRGSEVLVWDLAIPDHPQLAVVRVPARLPGSPVEGHALSADGTRLVAITNRGISLWDTANGTPTAREVFRSGKHRRRVSAVACSPTKPLFATGDTGGQVFLWDHTGHVLTRLDWGLDEVYALCFAPDGLRCAAIDRAGKVVVWDVDA